ncbi:hypothetical protein Slala05_75210 [Streptomyces lavendulae subsp. lavendulae]|nr:hypothetical protein Slala05_75210 [Streptomyces lavendulae subsp. lavendulae]
MGSPRFFRLPWEHGSRLSAALKVTTAVRIAGVGPHPCHGAHGPRGRHTKQSESLRPDHRSHPDGWLTELRSVLTRWTASPRAAWWWLSGRDRIAARGLLPGLALAAAWRAGHGSVGGHGNAA